MRCSLPSVVGAVALLAGCSRYQLATIEVRDATNKEAVTSGRVMWSPGLTFEWFPPATTESRLGSDGVSQIRIAKGYRGFIDFEGPGYPPQRVDLPTGAGTDWVPLNLCGEPFAGWLLAYAGRESRIAEVRITRGGPAR